MKTNNIQRISLEEKNELRAKHRLELLMQELGERFEVSAKNKNVWRSTSTPGLTVDIKRQRFEISMPGKAAEGGDVFGWLMRYYSWTFPQAIRYLQHRAPDPNQDEQPATVEVNPKLAKQTDYYFESESLNKQAEESGLYEKCVESRNGKISYCYLLKPTDAWQERALEIVGEKIRKYFTWKAETIRLVMDDQPARFIPLQDMEIEICDKCEEKIKWWWKQTPEFEYREVPPDLRNGQAYERQRVRVIHEPQAYVFECEEYEEKIYVCEKCKRKMIDFREALRLLARSADKREAPERKRQELAEREAARAEAQAREREEERLQIEADDLFFASQA